MYLIFIVKRWTFCALFLQSSHYQSIMSKKIFANDFIYLRISHSCEKWCPKMAVLRYKYSVFSQMMQMKTQKKGFAKIIRHGRLMAKIDNMLIIRTLAIFRFFANVFGFKTIAVKFIKLLTSDKKKPPSMWFYIRLAHFRCYLVYILSSSFTSWSRSGGNHGFFDFFPYLCTQIAKWTWKRLQLSIVSI